MIGKKCENYHRFSVVTSVGWSYGRIIKTRIEAKIHDTEEQNGLYAERSGTDNVFAWNSFVRRLPTMEWICISYLLTCMKHVVGFHYESSDQPYIKLVLVLLILQHWVTFIRRDVYKRQVLYYALCWWSGYNPG